ncbi:hypothetical protein ABZV29_42020, partial [Streptomyces sp. NPDC005236]
APVYGGDTRSLEVFPSSVVPGADVTVNTAACRPGRRDHDGGARPAAFPVPPPADGAARPGG